MTYLTGLEVNLTLGGGYGAKKLALSTIGSKIDDWSESTIEFSSASDRPSAISILIDGFGICNVLVERNEKWAPLNRHNMNCTFGTKGITEKTMLMTKETPLVGFHGMSEEEGMESLGLILLDTMAPAC